MKKLLIGTTNPSKYGSMLQQLEGIDVASISPAELGIQVDSAEDARTAEGNALEKARAWHQTTGLPVLTEDSGLVFLDLPPDHPDQPSVHVRRAAGHVMTDDEMFDWFTALAHRHGGKLRAAWQDAWCLMIDEDHCFTYADSVDELGPWSFWMMDHPVHDLIQPGWPLERIIIRSEESAVARKWGRERLRKWLKENIASL
ncbi:MAG: hypothetical protein J1E43_00105 [Christensenellaceae bacterium]|nr:hypothetical protein [Christensenellaceae bacterium]